MSELILTSIARLYFHRELNKWKTSREQDLRQAEEQELKQAELDIRRKIQGDIGIVAKKLNEETREKRQQMTLDITEKIRASLNHNVTAFYS